MINIIRAEFQKSKRTSINKFIIITPLFTILLSLLWGGGQNGAYNWWYVIFLPGMLSIISAQAITKEKSISYKGLFLYPQNKVAIWLGKIIYIIILLVLSSLIFMIGVIGIGFLGTELIYESTIPLKANILATIILILTCLFQIPISLFLTAKFNMSLAIVVNIVMTSFGVINFGTNSFLELNPYGIPSALMVPILHIYPNGLLVIENSLLLNESILVRDTIISFFIFLILTTLTAIWFRDKEVN